MNSGLWGVYVEGCLDFTEIRQLTTEEGLMRTQDNLAYLQGHLLRHVAAIESTHGTHNAWIIAQRRLPKHLRVHVSAYWRKAVEEVGIVCTGMGISRGAFARSTFTCSCT